MKFRETTPIHNTPQQKSDKHQQHTHTQKQKKTTKKKTQLQIKQTFHPTKTHTHTHKKKKRKQRLVSTFLQFLSQDLCLFPSFSCLICFASTNSMPILRITGLHWLLLTWPEVLKRKGGQTTGCFCRNMAWEFIIFTYILTQPMDPEKKFELYFPYSICNPKKFKVWPFAEWVYIYINTNSEYISYSSSFTGSSSLVFWQKFPVIFQPTLPDQPFFRRTSNLCTAASQDPKFVISISKAVDHPDRWGKKRCSLGRRILQLDQQKYMKSTHTWSL